MTKFGYVASLNGVRAFAVLAVVLSHGLGGSLQGGKTGVIVFFALSGFLITSILLKELAVSGRVSMKDFYVRRALRLFPAMILACAAFAVLALLVGGESGRRTLSALPAGVFYFLNWYNISTPEGVGLIGHFWSLSVEEQFYFAWPLLALGAYRLFKVKGVMWTALAGTAASYSSKWLSLASPTRQTGTDFAADALLLGCALACAFSLYPAHVRTTSRFLLWPAVVGILAALALGNSESGASEVESAQFSRLWWLLAAAGATALVAACASGSLPRWVQSVLEWRPIAYVGKVSYGVYLYHMIFLVAFAGIAPSGHLWDLLMLGLALVLTVGLAALSFELVERRFLRLKPPHKIYLVEPDGTPEALSR